MLELLQGAQQAKVFRGQDRTVRTLYKVISVTPRTTKHKDKENQERRWR